jgi:glycosyltransferase involved in cell wall biosynthesis
VNLRFTSIHQFHSGTSVGDAITNQMLNLQQILWRMGYNSEVFAEHIPDGLRQRVRSFSDLNDEESSLLLIHHSMGHRLFNRLMEHRGPVATIFHNITPPDQLDHPEQRYFSRLGRHQLSLLAKKSMFGVADSNYNRLEMHRAGFTNIEVIPVRTDYSEFESARQSRQRERDWLFVGRVVPNKRQLEIVQAFAAFLRSADNGENLYLIGSHYSSEYVRLINNAIESLGLVGRVILPGMVSQEELVNRYTRAGVFVSLSTHEGFGVPLLEAMASGVPIVAVTSSAVTETLGGAGILLVDDSPESVASSARSVLYDDGVHATTVWRQDLRLSRIVKFDTPAAFHRVLTRVAGNQYRAQVQVQGPLETSYSLAVLNREVALGLAANHDDFEVSAYPTEGPGDYPPNLEKMSDIPGLVELYDRGKTSPYPDVVIRQMYPPRVADSPGLYTVQYFGWEESLVPKSYVDDFNQHVDRIIVMSEFVKTALKSSGTTVPIDVVGVGVRTPLTDSIVEIPELENLKSHRFLHVSSAFPRKGVDVLLRAYFEEFSGDDDTTLILKTFPNPHNDTGSILELLLKQKDNPPHVVWIDRDMNDDELGSLYKVATTYVHVARGEGFGLPVAEAMLARVPVISTRAGGLADFVSHSTALVVETSPAKALTHVSIEGSEWFEPDQVQLRRALRYEATGIDPQLRQERVTQAERVISSDYSWTAVGKRVHSVVQRTISSIKPMTVANVSSFNSKCGIAEYSSLLVNSFPSYVTSIPVADSGSWPVDWTAEESVLRLWTQSQEQDLSRLVEYLVTSECQIVHIQHNFGFFSPPDLCELIERVEEHKPVVVTFHRTKDMRRDDKVLSLSTHAEGLAHASALIVHEEHDEQRLSEWGLASNTLRIPHGAIPFMGVRSERPSMDDEIRIGTFGFLLPHKGLDQLLRAVKILQTSGRKVNLTALCALHPDPSSAATLQEIESLIEELNLSDSVYLDTSFREISDIHSVMSGMHSIVLPYSGTDESSSGVLAMLLSVGVPILTTDLDIFSGSKEALVQFGLPANSAEIAERLSLLFSDREQYLELSRRVTRRATQISWPAIGRQTAELYAKLITSRLSE